MADVIGERIAKRIDELRTNQSAVAADARMTQPSIARLISGETRETGKLLELARALQTTPEYLVGETDDPSLFTLEERRAGHRPAPSVREDEVEIPQIDLRYGMGGTYVDIPVDVELQAFSRRWLRQFTDAAPETLFWAQGQGNSMEPTIGDGEVVLIDRAQNRIGFGDNIYAFAYGEVGMMKRLRPLPDGSIEMHSDNPTINLPPAKAVDGELHVIGRVVAVVKRI